MIYALLGSWSNYWFRPQSTVAVSLPRVCICLVAALWMASFLPTVELWFGQMGILARPLAAMIVTFEQSSAWQLWSPLWFTDSVIVLSAWLVSGIILALIAAVGIGHRISLALLLLWIIGWSHRILWLNGPVEPALIAFVGYLLVQPGVPLWRLRSDRSTSSPSCTAGLALRLLQTHWWILVAAGLLSQLASLIWWRGEAVWWLASTGRSHVLTRDLLGGNAILTNALTHGAIVVELLALWLVLVPPARLFGLLLGIAVSLLYGAIADQTLYALLLLAGLSAFAVTPVISRDPIISRDD